MKLKTVEICKYGILVKSIHSHHNYLLSASYGPGTFDALTSGNKTESVRKAGYIDINILKENCNEVEFTVLKNNMCMFIYTKETHKLSRN